MSFDTESTAWASCKSAHFSRLLFFLFPVGGTVALRISGGLNIQPLVIYLQQLKCSGYQRLNCISSLSGGAKILTHLYQQPRLYMTDRRVVF